MFQFVQLLNKFHGLNNQYYAFLYSFEWNSYRESKCSDDIFYKICYKFEPRRLYTTAMRESVNGQCW